MNKTSQHGVSLWEMLIVITIIMIFTLFMLPWSKEITTHSKSLMLREQLIVSVRSAQAYANALQLPVAICSSKDQKRCGGSWIEGHLIFVNTQEDGVVHSEKNILECLSQSNQKGQLHLRIFPFYRQYLLFLPNTTLAETNGTFWYCAPNAVNPGWAITINRAGRPRVRDPDREGRITGVEC